MRCWTIATLLLPLLCHAAGPAHVAIPAGPARPLQSTIGFFDDTTAFIHVYGLTLLVDPAPGSDVPADLVLLTQPLAWHAITGQGRPLQIWDRLAVRKGRTRLHVTALPDPHGRQAALLLDFSPSCRILVHSAILDAPDIGTIPRHYPGARLALLRDADGPLLMTLADDGTAATLQRGQALRIGPACGGKAR
ncbi:hypothetical protein ACFFTM_20500 [Pseudoduganella plicata]|uniref:Uncharacterized protein n=1 Tax=Pseudoduganella plicata TaxID=321984 RepID=A0A4P7BES1_9BURK|nr:hypothetical protein [Pseudoduganella plicata]QBQ37241.1 hypothetical protein E1742_14445 [Pseudoduganella plicata]GGY98240.1 hypothetical protein GCM10007388_34670 [Pseudoduganella plicata]